MKPPLIRPLAPLACALAALSLDPGLVHGQTVNDFSLEDINPKSVRHEQMVSPGDYRLQISAYYFGSAG